MLISKFIWYKERLKDMLQVKVAYKNDSWAINEFKKRGINE